MLDLALAIARVVVGLIFAGHGAQKLFGWFGGHGPKGTAQFFAQVGLRPAGALAIIAGLFELIGGLALAAGLLTPLAALLPTAVMLTAIAFVHWPRGFWNSAGGWEYNLVLIANLALFGLAGPGSYAVDRYLGLTLPMPETYVVGFVVALVLVLALRLVGGPAAQPAARPAGA